MPTHTIFKQRFNDIRWNDDDDDDDDVMADAEYSPKYTRKNKIKERQKKMRT